MRKITIEVQTDSKEQIETIYFDVDNIVVKDGSLIQEQKFMCEYCVYRRHLINGRRLGQALKELILRMTKNDKCFERHSKNGKCYGLCGGDKHSNFLSYDCVSCCHLTMLVGGDEIALH